MKKVLIIALSLLLSGCSAIAPVSSYTISPNDVRAISLSETGSFSVSRVVVLANGVAEIMNSLKAGSLVVGRDISSAESGLEDIPIVTSGHQVLPEKVIALQPDLVIVDASTGPRTALDQIRSTGITIVQ